MKSLKVINGLGSLYRTWKSRLENEGKRSLVKRHTKTNTWEWDYDEDFCINTHQKGNYYRSLYNKVDRLVLPIEKNNLLY